jgi:hypothetical protein
MSSTGVFVSGILSASCTISSSLSTALLLTPSVGATINSAMMFLVHLAAGACHLRSALFHRKHLGELLGSLHGEQLEFAWLHLVHY